MINTAVIGISGYGQTHYMDILGLVERGCAKISAATVINQDEEVEKCRILRNLGCKIYSDYREMLEKHRGEIELCFIPTGIHLHKPMTIAALDAGMNVFVEKPAAATVQEVVAMQEAEKRNGKFVAVGYQTMYAPETMLMKRRILAGSLGKIRTIKCRALWPRWKSYYTRNNWAGKLKTGDNWVLDSPFNNALAHQLNMICFLAGSELAESAKLTEINAELYRANPINSADTACLDIHTENDIRLLFIVSHACETDQAVGPDIEVCGSHGDILWNHHRTVFRFRGGEENIPGTINDALRHCIMDQLLARISDPEAFICGLDIAGTQTLAVNGAHDAGEILTVPDEYVARKNENNDSRCFVPGLDQAIEQAFATEKRLHELNLPWTQTAGYCELRNYSGFGGC